MSKSNTFKKLAMCSLATAAMVAANQGVFAHTRLEKPTVQEGTSNPKTHAQSNKVHNYVTISHGCPPSTDRRATMGTSVVFPNAISYHPIIGIDSGAGKVYATDQDPTKYYSPLAGLGTFIRTGVWEFSSVKVDALGNIDGFWTGGKAYNQKISAPVNVDFYANTVTIAPASCARSVTFELAIADFCDISVPGATAKDEEVLYWSPIPNFSGVPGQPFGAPTADATRNIPAGPSYSNYDGYKDAAHTIAGDGWGSPATLTVNRDLTNNPLPQGCSGNGGAGDDVYVYPSAEQINNELPVWSNPDQTGINYWK
jgi:hypothetical protein